VSGSDSTEDRRGLGRVVPGLALLREYRVEWLRNDVAAGLSVAVALPVAIAYAELAGFPPVVGLYASILPLAVYAVRRMLERSGALERLGADAAPPNLRAAVEAHESRTTGIDLVVKAH
jgi:hypothetical protein